MVYSIIAGGDENFEDIGTTIMSGPLVEYHRKARENKTIRDAYKYRSTWEPQHQEKIDAKPDQWEKDYLKESFSFKYVNACTFLGQELVDAALNDLPPRSSLKFLTTFHILTDHPISHTLLTNGTVSIGSKQWKKFVSDSSDYFGLREINQDIFDVSISLLKTPTYRDYTEMLDSGVRPVLSNMRTTVSDLTIDEIESFKTEIRTKAADYKEWVEKSDKIAEAVTTTATIATSLAAGATLWGLGGFEESIDKLFLPLLVSRTTVKKVHDGIKTAKLEHLITRLLKSPSPKLSTRAGQLQLHSRN